MTDEIYYTALEIYDSQTGDEFSWEKYIKWSKLTQLKELVSLDGLLNGLAFKPDFDSKDDWNYIVTDGEMITLFFNSIDYVLGKVKGLNYFNLLAVIKEPNKEKAELETDFEFVGYDLIERGGDISALTNCGGFDETFLPTDLNEYGLISDIDKAKKIQMELPINNPAEHHADCYLYEVWRHKKIGRKTA
ncbi:hypothetical protein [Maribacter sp.]|uniref:hypothetical protein n=1 Tax=Maribacter sp. TaxID=1897614 RepID=UPI0025B8D103|nr:hypothetical protein [Maribacter sp.]